MAGAINSADVFCAKSHVSRETLMLYETWKSLLTRWNKKINLVSSNTISNFWLRHALDSQQLVRHIPDSARTVLDLGSGAGFPGIAIAIHLRGRQGVKVSLVESSGKKCNFLRTVIRELDLSAEVQQSRIEDLPAGPFDVITARAFAPLPKLLSYALPFWAAQTIGIFPKGESWEQEIRAAEIEWRFKTETFVSDTDDNARIVLLKDISKRVEEKIIGELA